LWGAKFGCNFLRMVQGTKANNIIGDLIAYGRTKWQLNGN